MIWAVVIVSVVGMAAVSAMAWLGHYAARHASDETRAQLHGQMAEERASYIEALRRSDEDRTVLLDRLSDREGRQVAAIFPPQMVKPEPRELRTVPWDADLTPLPGEEADDGA